MNNLNLVKYQDILEKQQPLYTYTAKVKDGLLQANQSHIKYMAEASRIGLDLLNKIRYA